ncbi:MAG: aminotransferase [Phycisphaeraceae bacterium]|nr:aminotransferase [Phycisphaeraceae bacterium]
MSGDSRRNRYDHDMSDAASIRLLTPGPTAVPEPVLAELARPVIHHRTAGFRAIFADVSKRLQRLYRTEGPVLTLAGSGTTAFEAAQVSLIGPGRRALTIASGKFGERWQDIYAAHGVEQERLDVPWGSAVTAGEIADALERSPEVDVVTLVVSETSTATMCDLRSIAEVVRKHNVLLIADGITAVGAIPIEMDAWGVDVLVAGSQKALMLPPGLGFVGLGPRALERLERPIALPAYCLDLRRWLESWRKDDVPFTPPISLIRGQQVALEMIETEGLENVWRRSAGLATATRSAFIAMGLDLVSRAPSDSLTGAFYPEGVEDAAFRARLRDAHHIQIAGGQSGRGAKWKGRIMRLSHMGHVDADDTLAALTAIEQELIAAGHDLAPGTAASAARKAGLSA